MCWRQRAILDDFSQLSAKLAPALLFDTNDNITELKVRKIAHNTKKRVGSCTARVSWAKTESQPMKRKS